MYGSELRGLLCPLLLLLVRERPGHGYDLAERLASLGVAGVESGHVYRVLRSLERDGMLASAWTASESGPARRRYALTLRGSAELDTLMSRVAELDQVLAACVQRWHHAATAPAADSGNGERRRPAVGEICRPVTAGHQPPVTAERPPPVTAGQ